MEIKTKNEEIEALNKKLALERFGINRFSFDNEMVEFYTGFPTYELFVTFYNAIKPTALSMKSVYYTQTDEVEKVDQKQWTQLMSYLCFSAD